MHPVHEGVSADVIFCHVWAVEVSDVLKTVELQSADRNELTEFKLLFRVLLILQTFAKNQSNKCSQSSTGFQSFFGQSGLSE